MGGWVFIDINGNGVRDAGETAGIAGVTDRAAECGDQRVLIQTVFSGGASGWFDFPGVVPGSYKVIELTQPAGYISTSPDTVMVTIVGGQHKAANFGEMDPADRDADPDRDGHAVRDLPADQHDGADLHAVSNVHPGADQHADEHAGAADCNADGNRDEHTGAADGNADGNARRTRRSRRRQRRRQPRRRR